MVKNDLYITVPSFFKCPISLDVMKSPVSLSTGVTYDRSNIQQWLDSGNNTCPATMQPLPSKDFVPNHNLHRLIQIWSDSLSPSSSSSSSSSPSSPPLLSHDQARDLINTLHHQLHHPSFHDSLSMIIDFATQSDDNRNFLANSDDIIPIIVGVLGNDTSTSTHELAIRVLDLILPDYTGDKEHLMRLILKGDRDFLSSILLLLQNGSLDSRIATARVLVAIALDPQPKLTIADKDGRLPELIRLVTDDSTSAEALHAGLSC